MYFITAMTNIVYEDTKFDSEEFKKHSTRCFGYYSDKEKAINAVVNNYCDMYETTYEFILIEKIGEGIHPDADIIGWFKYNGQINKYEPIEVERTGFCNYALG